MPHPQAPSESPWKTQGKPRSQQTATAKPSGLAFPHRRSRSTSVCSICRRYGALWAYYKPEQVQLKGETEFYVWQDKEVQFHRCKNCGCVTHWAPADEAWDTIAPNCRMLEREELEKLEIEKSDGPK